MPGRPRRYAVVGTGGVGAFYGARLAVAGHEVHFVARSDAAHIARHGLLVESPGGDLTPPVASVATRITELPEVDVVMIAVKTTDTAALLEDLASYVTPDQVVVAMQNGLGVEEALAAALPAGVPVLGAMCFVCSNKVGPGHVRHLDFEAVTVGEHASDGAPAGVTPAVTAVVADLTAAAIPATAVDHLASGRWRKLVWNIPYNGLSVVLDAGTDELMGDPASRALIEALMNEVVDAAIACGATVERSHVGKMLRDTEKMAPYATSMKLDFEAGRALELDAIYAAPIDAAGRAGFEMPRTSTLLAQLRFLDAGRSLP